MTWLRTATLVAACLAGLWSDARPQSSTLAIGQPLPAAAAFVDADGHRVTLAQLALDETSSPQATAPAGTKGAARRADKQAPRQAPRQAPTQDATQRAEDGATQGATQWRSTRRASSNGLLLLRIQAAWCGPCQWHADWSRELLASFPERLRVIDLIVADEDNQPAAAAALREWRTRAGAAITVVADVDRQFTTLSAPLFPAPAPLPRLLLLDARDLTIRAALSNPSPDVVSATITRELSAMSAAAAQSAPPVSRISPASHVSPVSPVSAATSAQSIAAAETSSPRAAQIVEPARAAALMDERFTRDQWDLIRAMRMPDAPPADPTNRVADDPRAAAFGRTLFFDQSLSPAGRSCSSCHAPDLLFTNGKDIASEGVGPGVRNVPTILLASHARWLLWDGRVDSAWAQAVMPFEDATEMGSSRLFVAHAVRARHAAEYEALFGPLPPLSDGARFPAAGLPGDPRWAAMRDADRTAVSGVLANVGKALAAFQRALRVQPTALDRYAAGDMQALTADEKDGLAAFLTAGCAQCHHGPRLSDDAFHTLRFPTGHDDGRADRGRVDGLARLRDDEFSRAGAFSDAPLPRRQPVDSPAALGAFRTPGLRGVPFTMPYGHGGGFGGLSSVIDAHRTGGLPPASRYAVGETEPWAQGFDPALTPKIIRFLQVLRADVTP